MWLTQLICIPHTNTIPCINLKSQLMLMFGDKCSHKQADRQTDKWTKLKQHVLIIQSREHKIAAHAKYFYHYFNLHTNQWATALLLRDKVEK